MNEQRSVERQMKIAQFEDEQGFCIGVEQNGKWVNYSKAEAVYYLLERGLPIEPFSTLEKMIEAGELNTAEIKVVLDYVRKRKFAEELLIERRAVMKAPILRPPKIVALGLNYLLHAKEGSFDVPEEPIIFLKAGSSVIGPGETVRIPRGLGRMDHEVELAVVIGKKATRVKKKDAHSHIAGYCICNDITARSLQTKDIEKRHPWFRSKSFDTFTPLGPWMVTADEFPPPVHLNLECRVNGRTRQRANTRDFVFDIPTAIEFITRHITLEPGDVVSTGTPAGIGPIRGGDTILSRIQNLGELRNPVRFE
jgi:5-oxopent-3-ene-1,2,5-tricarboxylate decarboxylase/2-hydroxyhepta-2,4-diene-1,7-dioate isomerase